MPYANSCETVPKPVSNVNINSTQIDATNALSLDVDNSGAATTEKSVAIQVIDENGANVSGNFRVRLWFVDTNNKEAEVSEVVPDNPGAPQLDFVTEDDGSYTLPVSHAGALDEWYICVELLGLVYIDGPLNLGS